MNTQKLFETIERITAHQCLESEMFEIISAVEEIQKTENPCFGCENCIVACCNGCINDKANF